MKRKINKSIEQIEQFYRYFRYDSSVYFKDLETGEFFEILKEAFRKIEDLTVCSQIMNKGVEISESKALEKSDFNYIPAHLEQWLECNQKKKRYYFKKKNLKFFSDEGHKYVFDNESCMLLEIKYNGFQMVECPEKAAMILCDASVIPEEMALKNSGYDSFPDYDISHSLIEDPYYKKTHQQDTGQSLQYLELDSACYVTQEDKRNLLRILPESFEYISDEQQIHKIKKEGIEISMEEAFEQSTERHVPDYLIRYLFDSEYICRCERETGKSIKWPADCFPGLRSRFVIKDLDEMTFYYSVDEDQYETMFGDGLYYHFDRAFLSKEILKKYVEFRSCEHLCGYEIRKLEIKLKDNQFVFKDPSGIIEEYDPEDVLSALDKICSDSHYDSSALDLLKLYCVLNRRKRCEDLIRLFKPRLYDIGKKTKDMDPKSPIYYPLLKPCHEYNGCAAFINKNTEYPSRTFTNCTNYNDLKKYQFVDKLQNIISIFEHVYALVLQIDYNIKETDTDEYENPPFDLCVTRLKQIIDELNDHLIDMGRMMEGDFEPFLLLEESDDVS